MFATRLNQTKPFTWRPAPPVRREREDEVEAMLQTPEARRAIDHFRLTGFFREPGTRGDVLLADVMRILG